MLLPQRILGPNHVLGFRKGRKGKQRWAKCGGEHKYEDCDRNVQPKCCNCGGQHNMTYGGCEVGKRAKEIQQVKTMNNISYAEVVKKVQGQKGAEDISQSQIFGAGQRGQGNRTTQLAADKFILLLM